MSSWVILKFPELTDFIKHLKKRKIHTYGLVIHQKESGSHGIITVSFKFRLTAKDVRKHEIIMCDMPYFSDLKTSYEHLRKKSRKAKEKMLQYINETFKKEANGYEFTKLDAEFKLADSTREDF